MAMTTKQKEKFQSEWKKPGNVKKNEIMSPGAVARGIVQTVTPNIVRKIQGKRMVEQNKKTVNKIADIQQKVKAEKIAKNSVKTKSRTTEKYRAEKNSAEKARVDTAKSGAAARYGAGKTEAKRQLPAKVVKVNSAVKAKSPDAAKSANAKALKAANKKGKK
jgi:hypothetical protein